MPLQRTDEATAFTDPGTLSVVFQMTDPEQQSVRVTVQAGVLQKLKGGANPLSAFALNREKIEGIASAKFDRQGGSLIVVREDDVPDEVAARSKER